MIMMATFVALWLTALLEGAGNMTSCHARNGCIPSPSGRSLKPARFCPGDEGAIKQYVTCYNPLTPALPKRERVLYGQQGE